MIYLFNSAYRPLYAIDALTVLALPVGATIIHRYRVRGEYRHVHPDLHNGIMRDGPRGVRRVWRGRDRVVRLGSPLRRAGLPVPEAEPVLISFIDRYGPSGYIYHPLRLGTLFEVWERDDRAYFRVRLEDYVAAAGERADALSNDIWQVLSEKNPPTLVPGNPEAENDGYYALQGPDVLHGRPGLLRGESAWVATVEALAATRKLGSSQTRTVVFVRSQLQRLAPDADPEPPRLFAGAERIPLRKDAMYELRISYRCPAHATGSGTLARLQVLHGDNLQVLEADSLPVNATADELWIPLTTKRYVEDRYSFLRVDIQPPRGADVPPPDPASATRVPSHPGEVLGPKLNVLLALQEGRWFWPSTLMALGLFVLAGLVLGVNAAQLAGVAPGNLPSTIWAQITGPRVAGAIVQAVALLWLFRLIGKKPV